VLNEQRIGRFFSTSEVIWKIEQHVHRNGGSDNLKIVAIDSSDMHRIFLHIPREQAGAKRKGKPMGLWAM
jgi:hypothetical protein